jgi:hypothetical protein
MSQTQVVDLNDKDGLLVVGTTTGYGLDSRGLIPGRGMTFFLLHSVQTSSESHLSNGYQELFPPG